MNKSASLIIAAAVIIIALSILSTKGRKAPPVPADTLHAPVITQEGCALCHALGNQAPLKPGHPPKEQCLICHKIEKRS